ncbi:hypothetical protein ASC64_07855 [Nocardioides sp. Root122]|nr:hypothetical protein ASC64_07855 [Nocardioides sp. Root122]
MTVASGARMYPAYDPATTRYAVFPAADGSVRVDVTDATDVAFNGVPDADGTRTFTGLRAGEEISVFIGSGQERRAVAFYVVPDGFPTLAAESTDAPVEPGNIALTLDRYDNSTAPRFETIVDRNGVPVYTRSHAERVLDLKLNGNGRFTVHRPTTTAGRTGGALVELDDQFREVARHETAGLENTDDHDSLLLPDGSEWLIAYEPNAATGLIDSVIQHLGPDGSVLWQWTSAPYADETVVPGDVDYAHINSIEVQPNGDVLASFRNFSSVFLIRPTTDPADDEVVWKLGGRTSDFTFPALSDGSADTGVCAQHSAKILTNGHVLVFDNGSGAFFGRPLCVDQQDPERGSVYRPSTRVVEFELAGGIATPVKTYGESDRFAWFMGSATQFDSGNMLIGWSSAPSSIAAETDSAGRTIWRLSDTQQPVDGVVPRAYISYRAALVPARDGFDPEVAVDGPADGTSVTQGSVVPVSFSCTDRGGSTLQSCDGPAGRQLDTSVPGTHTWSVTARDGSGGTTTRSRSFTVVAPVVPPPTPTTPPSAVSRPDLALRVPPGRWVGTGSLAPTAQVLRTKVRPGRTVRATLRVRNAGGARGRFVLRAPRSLARGTLRVSYVHRGVDRSRRLSRHGWRTPALAPGQVLRLRVRVKAGASASAGRPAVRVVATSPQGRRDVVRLLVRVTRDM